MGKYSRSFFENPYLEDGQKHKLSAEIVMDDARQKWRTGIWRARPEDFELRREQLTEGEERGDRPSSSRFKLDITKDLMGEGISLSALRELDYSPSYRPKGNLDEELLVRPMSTMQRYDVLAGELESPPEDMSFLSDADVRRERSGEKHDGRLRRTSQRLESSVDVRRSELLRQLPDVGRERADEIIEEAKRRREREEIELGKRRRRREEKKAKLREDDDSRLSRLPEQAGMEESTAPLPEFESQTRLWSQIDPQAKWSDIAKNTISTMPEDLEIPPRRAHYADESRPDGQIRRFGTHSPRARLHSSEVGSFENEYLQKEGVDTDRIREIMDHKYRGRWIPPEFFADDDLVHEWFNQFSRGAVADEDFVHWAYRQRRMVEQRQEDERRARQVKLERRIPTDGRHASPFMPPPPEYAPMPREAYYDMYGDARQMGYRQGADIASREEKERREAEKKRKKAQREEQARRVASQAPPFAYPYGGYPQYGTPPPAAGYQGMYPDLFAGKGTGAQPPEHRAAPSPMRDYDPAKLGEDEDERPKKNRKKKKK